MVLVSILIGAFALPPRSVPPGLVAPRGKGVVRSRLVEIQPEALRGGLVSFDFFDDAKLNATVRSAGRAFGGAEIFEGQSGDTTVVLSVLDGQIFGNVKKGDYWYQIRYVGHGLHAVVEMDESQLGESLEPVVVPAHHAADAVMAADDGSVIDVLVMYTPRARSAVGGLAGITNLINTAIAETNTAYQNSGVTQRLRLVHAAEAANWIVGGAAVNADHYSFTNALTIFSADGDGMLDEAHTLRDTYGADAVALIMDRADACGVAFLMDHVSSSFESAAFSVTDWACATGYYSFGHELGHNMGLAHDRANSSGGGAYSYAYGWRDPGGRFRTIMAYACPYSSCPRIQYFSNPSVIYNGAATGSPLGTATEAYNALALNTTAHTFANFRATVVPIGSPPTNVIAAASMVTDTSPPSVRVTWNASTGATSYEIARRSAGTDFVAIGTTTLLFFDDTTVERDRAYFYRVRSITPTGSSSYSSADLATTVYFTDNPLVAGSTVARRAHVTELRTAADAIRALGGLSPASFTDAVPTVMRATHITELRTAIDEALGALSLTGSTWSSGATAGSPIAAVHFQELRDRIR